MPVFVSYYVGYAFLQQTFSVLKGKLILKYAKCASLVYPERKILDFCGSATKQFHVLVSWVDGHTLIPKLFELKHVAYGSLYG